MSIHGNQITDICVFIFVQNQLKREDLEPIEYPNADKRAKEAKEFFRDDLRIDGKKVKVYKNLDKRDVLAVFKKIKAQAQEFESKHENDPNAVNAVFVHWVGFFLDEDFHDMDDFDIDDYIEPRYFQLTEKGQPIPVSQLLLEISAIEKT